MMLHFRDVQIGITKRIDVPRYCVANRSHDTYDAIKSPALRDNSVRGNSASVPAADGRTGSRSEFHPSKEESPRHPSLELARQPAPAGRPDGRTDGGWLKGARRTRAASV